MEIPSIKQEITDARKESPNIDRFLQIIEQLRAKRIIKKEKASRVNSYMSYSEFKRKLYRNESVSGRQWGNDATEQDLIQAAQDMLAEENPKYISQYLRVFTKATFPLEPDLLFSFIELDEPYLFIPAKTLSVLRNIQHPKVRDFALTLINDDRYVGRALGLFTKNFVNGDWDLITQLSSQSMEDDIYHSLGMSILNIFDEHPDKEAYQALLNMYEYGPCSHCREQTILALNSLNLLPDNIRQECFFDSNINIREIAHRDSAP